MAKRKYTKRSDYWDQFKKTPEGKSEAKLQAVSTTYSPELVGEPLYVSESSRLSGESTRTRLRSNRVATKTISDRFANIRNGVLPCKFSSDHVFVSDTIELTQKAYFNVPVVKSTIDIMAEFANSDVYLTGGTQKSKNFTQSWFDKINLERVKEQFFLEFYRSGNVFFWRIDSKLTADGVRSVVRNFSVSNAANASLPIRYSLLNPTDVGAKDTLFFDNPTFVKLLSDYELLKLKNPQTEDEKELKNSLPKELQKLIDSRGASTSSKIFMELDAEMLHAVFYKKQDYEPLAIPMTFAVLDDINKKMELKKVDQAIARSVENVILLITMGAEPDKGGVNQKNIAAMQNIFRNTSVGRVLVADYTTKADFIIPDMKKVLGKEKYEVLNTDIREGLQNIMLGDSKYADGQLKLRVFFQRLDEARDVFLRDFLQPEIDRVCKDFGLRNPPKANFTRLDTMDNEVLQKLVTRMMELGVLTPEQGMTVINTGDFPDAKELDDAQEKYKKQRDEGKFVPIMSNIPEQQVKMQEEQFDEEMKMREKEGPTPANNQVAKPKQSGGRPTGKSNSSFSVQALTDTIKDIDNFFVRAQKEYRSAMNLKRLNKQQKETIEELCSKIIIGQEQNSWDKALKEVCADRNKLLSLDILPEVESVAAEHMLEDYPAAILYHSTAKSV